MSENKKVFILPVEWTVTSTVAVEADTIEEAIDLYEQHEKDIPCDPTGDYLDESYKLSYDRCEIEECCRNNPNYYRSVGAHGIDADGNIF